MSARRSTRVRASAGAAAAGGGVGRGARRGGEGLPREHVTEIQRMRVLTAMAEVAAERGAGQTSVAHVVARAGVSRRTFYDLFEDREDCFLAAFEEALAQAAVTVIPAYRRPGKWREQIRSGLLALLVFCEQQPALARLCIAESLAAGPRALARREEIVDLLVGAVDRGRSERSTQAAEPPPLAAEGAVGAVLAVVHRRLVAEAVAVAVAPRPASPRPLSPRPASTRPLSPRPAPAQSQSLVSLLGELTCAIVLPYLGTSAARRELRKPTPPLPPPKPRPHGDPLEGLDMRITYRTVRALIAIAQAPRASNRDVAAAAGIADQGQVSKLLTRLHSLGLIRNEGSGHIKGGPNAWTLTQRGQEVERAIRVHSASGAPGAP